MSKIRELQQQRAAKIDALTALNAKIEAESRDYTNEEDAKFKAISAEIDAIGKKIEREETLLAHTLASKTLPYGSIQTGPEALEKDPKCGFTSLGDFAQAVYQQSVSPYSRDERMEMLSKSLIVNGQFQAVAPTTYSQESVGVDGGFLVPPEFSREVWRLQLEDPQNLMAQTENTEISGNSMVFPKDETTPWGGTGVVSYWEKEAAAVTASKLVLGADMMRLHKLFAMTPVTGELLSDAPALGSYLSNVAPERIMWKVNESILFGSGAGTPKGALSAGGPVVSVAKESGQTNLTVVQANISKMVSRLLPGELGRAIWIANPDIFPQLDAMVVGTYPIYLSPQSGMRDAPYGMLKGRPVLPTEHAKALGYEGDIALLSLKGYRTITSRGGIQTATSMHLYFDADATAMRWIFRIDGKPILSAAVTPPNSSNTRSHFVTLADRHA